MYRVCPAGSNDLQALSDSLELIEGDAMKRREFILSGNYQMLDQLYEELLATRAELSVCRYKCQKLKDSLDAVTAVCNGSSVMAHLDEFRNADAMLQEEENNKLSGSLEKISRIREMYPALNNNDKLRACIAEAKGTLAGL
jgi:hypothetical protein